MGPFPNWKTEKIFLNLEDHKCICEAYFYILKDKIGVFLKKTFVKQFFFYSFTNHFNASMFLVIGKQP